MVKSAAPKLGPLGRTAGMRLHIPGFLMSNSKLLENTGYHMRTTGAGVKHVMKFDDEAQDLMMDVRVNGKWKRVRPADADGARASNPALSAPSNGPETFSAADIADFIANPSSNASASGSTAGASSQAGASASSGAPQGSTEAGSDDDMNE